MKHKPDVMVHPTLLVNLQAWKGGELRYVLGECVVACNKKHVEALLEQPINSKNEISLMTALVWMWNTL